jgi:hypothetical protein
MATRHPLDRLDIDELQLAEELGGALGRPVAVRTRPPGQREDDGRELPGVIEVLDQTGEPLDLDEAAVAAVLDTHRPRPRRRTAEDRVADLEARVATLDALEPRLAALETRLQPIETRLATLEAFRSDTPTEPAPATGTSDVTA